MAVAARARRSRVGPRAAVSSASSSRRLDEKERRRGEILDAAEQVFEALGYDAAKVEDIARAARVSRALLYLYFRDKAALHFGLALRALHKLREAFAQAREPHAQGIDQLAAVGRTYIAFVRRHPVYFAALSRVEGHNASQENGAPLEDDLMEAGDRVHAETIAAILQGQRDGTIRKDLGSPVQVALTMWGFMHGAAQLAMTKAQIFELQGVKLEAFITGSVAMAARAVSTNAPPGPGRRRKR